MQGLDINAWEGIMHAVTLLAFAAVSFVAIATPGPTVLLALTNGSRYGVRRASAGLTGAVLSDFVLIGAVAVGLGALLAASEFWFAMLKYVGAAYLAFLGMMMFRSKGTFDAALKSGGQTGSGSPLSIGLKSFMVAVTNPKGYLFFSAFLPQFIDPTMPQATQYALLALIFASLDFLIMLGYAIFGSQAVRFLKTAGAVWIERACGGALLALAGSLALYRRATV
jgi:threonine/homoserine/homoserine lactone efflux protein